MMIFVLCLVFFLSGGAALIFESLWFHLTGLVFGNSVWATSIVLSSFMGGIALGNGLVAFQGHKIKKPLFAYALIEFIIAVSGVALVFGLPNLTEFLIPVYHLVQENTVLVNVLRAVLAFIFMVVPTSAMGATLPLLVKALHEKRKEFGQVLGTLYGWNTLGAVVGVVSSELFLVRWFGIKGTGIVAASFNVLAAVVVIVLYRTMTRSTSAHAPSFERPGVHNPDTFRTIRLLCASCFSGFTLLALEVIWFRFLLLFVNATGWSFAIMLAAVLTGISLGGFLASQGFRWRSDFEQALLPVVLLNGVLLIILYANFGFLYNLVRHYRTNIRVVFIALFLIFPISLISGMIFTMLGKALHQHIPSDTRATGLLTLSNTLGGSLGSLLATLILIPVLGIERSFLGLALSYGVIALLVARKVQFAPFTKPAVYRSLTVVTYLLVLVFFPFGFMDFHYLSIPLQKYEPSGEERIAIREGITETIQYLRKDFLNAPYYYRLLTNNYSMSTTSLTAKRYMSYFVHLPVAVNPNVKNALLICFGCGTTAKTLTDTKNLERIDVVDISEDVIESSQIVFPDPHENPLNDPRLNIHIEDGRFFLLATDQQFDLITAEPPPPKNSGIENLYTEEYFQLIYDRLADGGMVTYWLPVYQLSVPESKSIIKGFCNVFETCSLWTGSDLEWMLVGVKAPSSPVTEAEFGRQWDDPVVGPDLHAAGFESPEQFGAFFIADAHRLNDWIYDSLPLTDNYPQRLSFNAWNVPIYINEYLDFMDVTASQQNFLESNDIEKIWPESLKQQAIPYFRDRQIINGLLARPAWKSQPQMFYFHECLQNPSLNNYILWVLESDQYAQQILADTLKNNPELVRQDPEAYLHLAAKALQEKKYLQAEYYLHFMTNLNIVDRGGQSLSLEFYKMRMYLLYLEGREQDAVETGQEYIEQKAADRELAVREIEEYWNWLREVLGEREKR